ncbi:hypothetical protein ACGFX8_25020 [Streptomyces sp. NPDC048362]|uniref:hypothetical protein n=1 Tax=Streptomyces sp. NPDC048362 TaxID=3365539 RepID=UPI003713EF6E
MQNDARYERLQHIRLHLSRGGARGVLFVAAEDGSSAEAYARTLWAAVARGEGPVSNWLLLECSALSLPAQA